MRRNSRFPENLAKKSFIIFMSILLFLGTSLVAKPQSANAEPEKFETTIGLSVNSLSYFGDQVILTATVNGVINASSFSTSSLGPTGTVTFYNGTTEIGSKPLTGGQATFITELYPNNLPLGDYSFNAVYEGDEYYLESPISNNAAHTVYPLPTTITVTSAPNPEDYGQSVTFTAVVAKAEYGDGSVSIASDDPTPLPDPTGTVTFSIDGTPTTVALTNGQATLTSDSLYPGSQNVEAVFNPDDGSPYETSNTYYYDQFVRIPTEITLTSSKNPSTVGEAVYFTAEIASINYTQSLDFQASARNEPAGTVTFYDGTVELETVSVGFHADSINISTISNPTAMIHTTALTAGNHNITAIYTADTDQDYYMSSESGTLVQVVQSGVPAPIPTASPVPSPTPNPTRQVKVDFGNEASGNQVDITRSSNTDGTKVDSVIFDKDKTNEIVTKAVSSGKSVARIVIDDLPNDKADEVTVSIPKASIGALTDKAMQFEISTNDVKITLSKDSLEELNKDAKDLFFRFIPINKPEARTVAEDRVNKEIKLMVVSQNQTLTLVSKPMTIETNYSSRKTTLEFPLADIKLPDNAEERAAFLSELAVFIEHSDGEKVVNKGKIIYDSLGKPVGIEIEIEKFSTFTIIQAKDKARKAYAPYIKGFPDGTFQPNKSLTRAELAAILARMLPSDAPVGKNSFTDVPADSWATKSILQVSEAGYMSGDGYGKFHPNQNVTRAELAKISVLWEKLQTTQNAAQFSDLEGHWASAFIAAIQIKGFMQGYDDGSFRPNQPLSRAEAVHVLNQLFHRPTFKDANLGEWSDVGSQLWANHDIQAASHPFTTIVQDDGSETLAVTK